MHKLVAEHPNNRTELTIENFSAYHKCVIFCVVDAVAQQLLFSLSNMI